MTSAKSAIERLFDELESFLDYDGNDERDETLGPALDAAKEEFERARVSGLAITPEVIRQIDHTTRSIADQWHTYLNSDDSELPDMDLAPIRSAVGLPPYKGEMLPDEEDEAEEMRRKEDEAMGPDN
jgi:hypothetical protein